MDGMADTLIPIPPEIEIDESLGEIERIEQYIKSFLPLQRLVHVKAIGEAATRCELEEVRTRLSPLLKDASSDDDIMVREAVAEQVSTVAVLLLKGGREEDYVYVVEELLGLATVLLGDDDGKVRDAFSQAFLDIAKHLRPEHIESPVLTKVLLMAHDENQNVRSHALQLLNGLMDIVSTDIILAFCLPEATSMCGDVSMRVRKDAAASLGKLAEKLDASKVEERVLPSYKKLCGDEIWSVRRAAAEILPKISKNVSQEVQRETLVPIAASMLEDSSKWVVTEVHQKFGMFLETMQREDIPDSLFEAFVEKTSGAMSSDTDLAFSFAYQVAGVLVVMGKGVWPYMRPIFDKLRTDVQWRVRRTLAFALHDIARAIGTESADQDILPAALEFVDDLDEVRTGLLHSLPQLLPLFSDSAAEMAHTRLRHLIHGTENWRYRARFAEFLPRLARVVPVSVMRKTVLPLLMQLLSDKAAAVRTEARNAVCDIYAHAAVRAAELADEEEAAASSAGSSDAATREPDASDARNPTAASTTNTATTEGEAASAPDSESAGDGKSASTTQTPQTSAEDARDHESADTAPDERHSDTDAAATAQESAQAGPSVTGAKETAQDFATVTATTGKVILFYSNRKKAMDRQQFVFMADILARALPRSVFEDFFLQRFLGMRHDSEVVVRVAFARVALGMRDAEELREKLGSETIGLIDGALGELKGDPDRDVCIYAHGGVIPEGFVRLARMDPRDDASNSERAASSSDVLGGGEGAKMPEGHNDRPGIFRPRKETLDMQVR